MPNNAPNGAGAGVIDAVLGGDEPEQDPMISSGVFYISESHRILLDSSMQLQLEHGNR